MVEPTKRRTNPAGRGGAPKESGAAVNIKITHLQFVHGGKRFVVRSMRWQELQEPIVEVGYGPS